MARRPVKKTGLELVEASISSSSDVPDQVALVQEIIQAVDEQIEQSVRRRDAPKMFSLIKGAFSDRHASDIRAIQLCYRAEERWPELNLGGGDFIDYARDETGKGVETIKRYSQIGKMMNEVVPPKYRNTLWCRPIRNLVAIAQAVNEHGDFDDKEWHRLSQCINGQEVRLVLDELLAKERKPTNRLTITIDREGGLTAIKKGKHASIGMLRLEPEDELVAEAVQRIIASAGVLEQ